MSFHLIFLSWFGELIFSGNALSTALVAVAACLNNTVVAPMSFLYFFGWFFFFLFFTFSGTRRVRRMCIVSFYGLFNIIFSGCGIFLGPFC